MSQSSSPSSSNANRSRGAFLLAVVILGAVLGVLFHRSFESGVVAFSNDGPLGVQKSETISLPGGFKGMWYLTWLGSSGGNAYLSISELFRWLSGPEGYSKYYEPFSLFVLGLCAWAFFRSLRLGPALCTVATLGAALNSNFFSNVCWGLGSRALTLACIFLAMAALNARRCGNRWTNAILAGLAVGMSVVEGADNGVIFSLCVAAYVVYQSFVEESSPRDRVIKSLRLALVSGFAVLIAVQALLPLFQIAEQGQSKSSDDAAAKEAKWDFATQWSLPPAETLRVIVPGLYGYRMDAPKGDLSSAYWGRVGESPKTPAQMPRFNGSGEYAGMLVLLVGLWAVIVSFSRNAGAYSEVERKMIWFWLSLVVICIPLAWGRFAPFYQFVYALPYFSSIRNPMKFMHPAHLGLMVLFGYGLLGMSRRYLEKPSAEGSFGKLFKAWWSKATSPERVWTWTVVAMIVVSGILFLKYAGTREDLYYHLTQTGFADQGQTAGLAAKIASFSINEVGIAVMVMVVSGAGLFVLMSGKLSGQRSMFAIILLGTILTADLWRANVPWVIHVNVARKYASNPVIDYLSDKPWKGRIMSPSILFNSREFTHENYSYLFPQVYAIEWMQHHFRAMNVQSLEVEQEPRTTSDKGRFMAAFGRPDAYLNMGEDYWKKLPGQYRFATLRYWQLTNTRYLIGTAGFLDILNSQMGAGQGQFRTVTNFNIVAKPGPAPSKLEDFTAQPDPRGTLALFEFTGALPRAKLYTHWEVMTNSDNVLQKLIDPTFNPDSEVLVSEEVPVSEAAVTNTIAGTAEITSYSTHRIEIAAGAPVSSVLLLNDRYDENWRVSVDGKPARTLQCNFIMRGVQLPPGQHTVVYEFEIRPQFKGIPVKYFSLAGIVLAALCALVMLFCQSAEPAAGAGSQSVPQKTPKN